MLQSIEVKLDNLLLDPNNYRLQEGDNFSITPEDRYGLEQIQKTALQRLQKEALKELKGSILANGFLPIERIIVTSYQDSGMYLVVEGNRRVAALKSIKENHEAGIEVPAAIVGIFTAVPCLLVESNDEFPAFKETLMGIRHVGGIRQWGGYQRAKLIADLRDQHKMEASDVSERLGLSVQEVNRRYRAFKALQQMQESEEFGEYALPAMYPIFHEAIALPGIRSWLGWNQTTCTFDKDEERDSFYGLITPSSGENSGDEKPAKVATYLDVRELKHIIGNSEAQQYLLDREKSLIDALAIAKKDEISTKWRSEVLEACAALEKISAIEVASFVDDDINTINNMIELGKKIIKIHNAISGNHP